MFSILRPFLFKLDPEIAHDLAIKSLKHDYLPSKLFEVDNEEVLNIKVFGKNFPNPIGLAAGFDKSAEVYNACFKIGFGFVEVGTVTPKKQFGNTKPRLFRLTEDRALINRLGFNNDGMVEVKKRIISNEKRGILGINIGPNKETLNQIDDFSLCLKELNNLADYITINISSPNTEGLRDFHKRENLKNLIKNLVEPFKNKNEDSVLLLKISPDINNEEVQVIAEILLSMEINGLVVSNTTTQNRDKLKSLLRDEKGGLSGRPLEDVSTNLISKFYRLIGKKIPIIGVGGVYSAESAYKKILAGASLLQLYTGLIFEGPFLIKNIKKDLIKMVQEDGFKNIKDAIGKRS
jgi:dihydroorotate dehydrogenase